MEEWNDLCYIISKYRNSNSSEREFQIEIVNWLKDLGWSRRTEIEEQRSIPIGAAQTLIPDIIVKKDNKDIFVVEIKAPGNVPVIRNEEQIISYMKQTKVNFGLLIGRTIKIYYDNPNDREDPEFVAELPMHEDYDEGELLVNTISKENYSEREIEEYYQYKKAQQLKKMQIEELQNSLCVGYGKECLKEYLQKDYSADVIDAALENITIVRKYKKQIIDDPIDVKEMPDKKIGEIAKVALRQMLESHTFSSEELQRLQDRTYAKNTFKLSYPLLVEKDSEHDRVRYYKQSVRVNGMEYKLCSQWLEKSREALLEWLAKYDVYPDQFVEKK